MVRRRRSRSRGLTRRRRRARTRDGGCRTTTTPGRARRRYLPGAACRHRRRRSRRPACPPRFDVNATRVPSGETAGRQSSASPVVIGCAWLPVPSIDQILRRPLRVEVTTIRSDAGDTDGSPSLDPEAPIVVRRPGPRARSLSSLTISPVLRRARQTSDVPSCETYGSVYLARAHREAHLGRAVERVPPEFRPSPLWSPA